METPEKKEKVEKTEKKPVPVAKWYLVDAKDKILGRLSTRIADVLRGKDNPAFVRNADKGAYVVVINAEKVRVTGKKYEQKTYYRHSTYPGGLKQRTFKEQMQKDPTQIIIHAVQGMIPHNSLGRKIATKLFVYAGPEHKHQAQKPVLLNA